MLPAALKSVYGPSLRVGFATLTLNALTHSRTRSFSSCVSLAAQVATDAGWLDYEPIVADAITMAHVKNLPYVQVC
jgi:hypothetical protein